MTPYHKSEKEPIELLLGMGGAVQYLEHTSKDELNYLVSVKTKTGIKQITIPIKAVELIQSRKPTAEVIESIKRQLALEPSNDEVDFPSQVKGADRPSFRFWYWLRSLIDLHN